MENLTVTEIVTFKTAEAYSDNTLIQIVDSLNKNFMTKQAGYLDTELIKGKEERAWMMILHWESMELAKEVSKVFVKSPDTEEYRNALAEVNLHFTEQVKFWKAI